LKSAETGNAVRVHYTGTLNDGNVFDSSREREPLEFTIGSGQLIRGFEDAVLGMTAGDVKTIKISAAEAYGDRREELVITINRKQFPDHINPAEGLQLDLKSPDGSVLNAIITALEEESVTLDANHPLAGQDINFDIELLEIVTDGQTMADH
jgi:peptidylprolyl isomerase